MSYKRLFYIVSVAFVFTFIFAVFVAVDAYADRPITVYVDGKKIEFPDAKPQFINGRIFVPIRFVSEALGAKVERDVTTNSVFITSAPATVQEPVTEEPATNQPEPELIQAEVGEVIEFNNSKVKVNELTYYTNSSGKRFANINMDVYISAKPTNRLTWNALHFVDAYILDDGREIRGSMSTKDEIRTGEWNNVNVFFYVASENVAGVIVNDPININEKARIDF